MGNRNRNNRGNKVFYRGTLEEQKKHDQMIREALANAGKTKARPETLPTNDGRRDSDDEFPCGSFYKD